MIRTRRPSPELIERYRIECAAMEPTFATPGSRPPGFHSGVVSVELGRDPQMIQRARFALVGWEVHHGAGVVPHPSAPPLDVGTTVALVTRQLGLWILAACRVTATVDTESAFGFTYATLPGHPERGEESFTIRSDGTGLTSFEIAATWRSDALIARVGPPVAVALQRRATQRYLDAMVRACSGSGER